MEQAVRRMETLGFKLLAQREMNAAILSRPPFRISLPVKWPLVSTTTVTVFAVPYFIGGMGMGGAWMTFFFAILLA